MPDAINTEGAISADTALVKPSRWAFLKEKVKTVLRRPKNNPEPAKIETPPAKTEMEVQRDQLAKTLQERGIKFAADNIVRLYPDFIKYLRDPAKVKDPELSRRAEQALNSGDIEVIDTLANIMQAQYEDELKQAQPNLSEEQLLNKQKSTGLNVAERQALDEMQFNKPGYKKAVAKNLAYYLSEIIKRDKGRDSVGGSMDLKLALSSNANALDAKAAVNAASEMLKTPQNPPVTTSVKT